MRDQLTRRGWVATLAGSATAMAQAPPAQEAASDHPEALLKQARDQLQKNFEALRRVRIPGPTEPAFVFRA